MMERWEHSLFKTLLTFCRISEITHRVGSGQWCSSHHSWGNGYDHEIVLHPITDLATLLGILFFFAYGETKHNKKPMTKMMRCWTSVFALEKRLTQGSFNNRKVRFFWPLKKKNEVFPFLSMVFAAFFQRFSSRGHGNRRRNRRRHGRRLEPRFGSAKGTPSQEGCGDSDLKIGRTTQPKTTEAITVYLYITLYITHLYVFFVYFFVRWFSGFTIAWVFFQSLDSKSTSSHAKRWCH